ncbi:hypothetical protein [Rhizobium sp. RCAM05973]|uniref:hypothetical protein n=1 Tax=Rhizobium sp. RCAM05973 TaxID=2994066 RepID=UPI0022EBCF0C|nr:hypothetical protein [Rhizobium sp. RCAM05973]
MTTPHESDLLSAAEAMRDAEIGYTIKLTNMVDGVPTEYALTISDGRAPMSFPSHAAASEFVERERNLAKAKAAVDAYLAGIGDGWLLIDNAAKSGDDILAVGVDAYGAGHYEVVSYEITDSAPWVWHTHDGLAYHEGAFSHYRLLPAPPSIPSDEGSEKP